jgi:hypothetical protein
MLEILCLHRVNGVLCFVEVDRRRSSKRGVVLDHNRLADENDSSLRAFGVVRRRKMRVSGREGHLTATALHSFSSSEPARHRHNTAIAILLAAAQHENAARCHVHFI